MPVTAKLRFGDDVANELVDWFNMVDATYRSDLRELNELNFARFDAKLEQRLAQLETRLTKRLFGFWVAQAATTAALVLESLRSCINKHPGTPPRLTA